MNIVVIVALGRGLDALGFLLAVVGFDTQAGVNLGLEDAGLLLPLVLTVALYHLRTATALPDPIRHIAPATRVALALSVVLGSGGVEVAELFEDRQFGQGLGYIHIALQRIPEGQGFFEVHAQGLDFATKKYLDRGVAVMQPDGETAVAMGARAELQGGVELVERGAKGLLEASADGQHAGLAVKAAAIVGEYAQVEVLQVIPADQAHKDAKGHAGAEPEQVDSVGRGLKGY